jgi:hypothetical protein
VVPLASRVRRVVVPESSFGDRQPVSLLARGRWRWYSGARLVRSGQGTLQTRWELNEMADWDQGPTWLPLWMRAFTTLAVIVTICAAVGILRMLLQ